MEGLFKAWNSLVPVKKENFNLTLDEFDKVKGSNDTLRDWYLEDNLDTVISLSYDGRKVYKYLGMKCGRNTNVLSFVDYVFMKIAEKCRGYKHSKLVMASITEAGRGVLVEAYFEEEPKLSFIFADRDGDGKLHYCRNSKNFRMEIYDILDFETLLMKAIGSLTELCPVPIRRIECWVTKPIEVGENLRFEKDFSVGFCEYTRENGYDVDVRGEYTMAYLVGKC